MKAVILVGGYGTRLQPLTLTHPKPLMPFMNTPILLRQMDALAEVGADEIILALGYMHRQIEIEANAYASRKKIKVSFSVEESPMGTAGALSLLRKQLDQEKNPFFLLNSDVTCEFPLKQMYSAHLSGTHTGTILITQVSDPSKYGVVLLNEKNDVYGFHEKPTTYVGDRINAGVYLLNKEIFNLIEDKPMSLEKEVLPVLAQKGALKGYHLEGPWIDIGKPKDYLLGHYIWLEGLKKDFLIDSTSKVSDKAYIGKGVVIGGFVEVAEGAYIERSILLSGSKIEKNAVVLNSVIGWEVSVKKGAHVEEGSIIGANAVIEEEIYVVDAHILPGTYVSADVSSISAPSSIPVSTPNESTI